MKLNKELIEKLAKGEIAIDYTLNKNLELLRTVLKEAFPQDSTKPGGSANYYTRLGSFWVATITMDLPKVPLVDFLEKEEIFPIDDFGVIVENNNGKEIIDYLVSKGFKNSYSQSGTALNNSFYFIEKNTLAIRCGITNPNSKTYTLEQLKQLDMENKEIEYYEVLQECWGFDGMPWKKGQKVYFGNTQSLPYLKKIGLLDNLEFFKPVYKEIKTLPKIGGYEGKVENEFVIYGNNCAKFHKSFFRNLIDVNTVVKEKGGNRLIKSIKLDSGVEITMEQVRQIVEFIDGK